MIRDLYSDSDAPALDLGIQGRLHRLDDRLALTWSRWQIDLRTSQPIETCMDAMTGLVCAPRRIEQVDPGTRKPHPCWHLWIRQPEGVYLYVRQYAEFGHQQVENLEADPARKIGADAVLADAKDDLATQLERRKTRAEERRREMLAANHQRVQKLVDGVTDSAVGMRTGKFTSHQGQKNRSSLGPVAMDSREAGWVSYEEV